MERANKDELFAEKDKSYKRRHDDQDLPPPPPDLDPSKNRRHASDALDNEPSQIQGHTDNCSSSQKKPDTDWLKHVPEDDRPATPEPTGLYQDPDEYKLRRKTGNMSSFINWFCKRIGKKKLGKADLEGPAFKVVRPFHDNIISLQFQMEECH
ncbi:hypothetical protein Tco_0996133 [Tanacetum coccineum]